MSVRINKAKNFKGKAYVAADELDNLIQSMQFATALLENTATDNGWIVEFQYADQDGTTNKKTAVDLTAIKQYIDNKAINVAAGGGITIDTTNALNPKISADIDSSTIVWSGTGDTAKLATGLKIVKLATTTTGYAASYGLADASGTVISGSTPIDIVKDQFIKSAVFGWADTATSTPTTWDADKAQITGTAYPCIKLEVYVNENGVSNDDTLVSTIYIPLADTFQEYKAGDAIAINADAQDGKLVISAVKGTSEQVSIADDSTVDVLTINGTGIGVTNIQKAINYAVDNEHAKASAAISAVDSNVVALATSVSAAVTSINTRVANVETNAATAVANASANLSTQIAGVATNASAAVSKIASALDALDEAVATAVSDVNTNVETAIDSVVTNVSGALATTVANVNTAVSAAVETVNTKVDNAVDSVNGAVSGLMTTVSTTIDNAQTAVNNFKTSVNTVVSAVEDNRNTQLTNAVQFVDYEADVPALVSGIATVQVRNVAKTSAGAAQNDLPAKYIIGVYASGIQIYPEITKVTGGFDLIAEYGSATPDGKWNVICAADLPTYVDAGDVAYTSANNTVAYGDAAKGDGASYSNSAAGAIAAVDATDVDYDGVADVAGTGVANGTAGTAGTGVATGSDADEPSIPDHVTKDAPNYTGHNNA